MIRYILLILLFESLSITLTGQLRKDDVKADFFDESLYLHAISNGIDENLSLDKWDGINNEILIAENLIDYPYQSDISTTSINGLENKNTILALVKKSLISEDFITARQTLMTVSVSDFNKEDRETYQFLKGYLNFVHKDFKKAQLVFDHSDGGKNRYKFENLYYSAFCDMFLSEYNSSYEKFAQLQNQGKYQNDLPYYMALMKYQLEDYPAVIHILKNELNFSQSIYEEAMRELLSRAYYKESKWDKLSDVLLSDSDCCKTAEEHYFVGLSLFKRGKEDQAINHLTESTKMGTEESQNALLALGTIYAKRDPSLALPFFKEAVQRNFNNELKDQALLAMAQVYYSKDQFSLALSSLGRIGDDSKQFTKSQSERIKILYHQGEYDKALTTLKNQNKSVKDNLLYQDLQLRSGIEAYEEKNYSKALPYLKEASELENDLSMSSRALHLLARIHFDQKNSEVLSEVVLKYENINKKRATRNIHTDSELYYLKAYSQLQDENFTAAIGAFNSSESALKKAFRVNTQPHHESMYEDILLRKGDCFFRLGMKQEAIAQYSLAYDQRVEFGDYALYQKGKVEDLMAEPYLQISTYDLLEQEFPGSKYLVDTWIKKGNILVQMNKQKEAYDQFAKVYQSKLSNEVQKYESLSKLGLITYNQGDLETALSFYKKVFDIDNITMIQKEETLLAIEEIYLKDLKDSEAYYAFIEKTDLKERPNINKDSIDYHLAKELLRTNKSEGITALGNYLKKYKNGKYRVNSLKEIAKNYEILADTKNAVNSYLQLIEEAPQTKELALIRIIHNLSQNESDLNEYVHFNKEILEENFSKQKNDLAYANIAKASIKTDRILEHDKHISLALRGNELSEYEKDYIRLSLVKSQHIKQQYKSSKFHLDILSQSKNDAIAAEALLLVGKRLYDLGKFEASYSASQASLERGKSDRNFVANVILLQAKIYFQKGELDAATSGIETILSQEGLDSSILKKADELMKGIKSKRKILKEKSNPTLNLQYGTHE